DYMGAHGALILGHADERVVAAISKAASKGSGFGAPSEIEVRLTELIVSRFPTIDMLRLVNTPAEALTGVVALARSHTGRSGIVTFDGCWHSYVGSVSAQAADGGTAESSPAVPYNSVEVIEELFRNRGSGIAAVIVEPVAASIGLIPPADGFLAFLRSLCDDHNVLLVFDETLTGFRLTPGGADAFYGVRPDLTLLGPIIGGGLPLAAYGGCKEVMKHADRNTGMPRTSPAAGNLLGMAAGLATLQAVGESGFYEALEAQSARLDEGLRAAAAAACVPTCHTRVASMLGMFFGEITVTDSASASRCDTALFAHYHRAMLDRGVFLPPSPLSPLFVSAAHSNDEIDRTIEAAHDALRIAGESSRR
ncbi:MAG: aminotransferase class III-fold pyridoxal phosphate-dependent enzyme, partial [Phycisphaerae bacterium]